MSFSPYPDPPSEERQQPDPLGRDREEEPEGNPEVERLLAVARGCHDYGGGYHDKHDAEVYHHGIQTVINALEAAAKNPGSLQIRVLESIASRPVVAEIPEWRKGDDECPI